MSRMQRITSSKPVSIFVMLLITVVGSVLNTVGSGEASAASRILVMPFTVHSSDDLEFLQKGITDMLVSRLEWENKVIVIVADKPGEDMAALASKVHPDYVVTGSLTVLGDRVSTDARVLVGTEKTPVLSFGRVGHQQADVISHIDELATLINSRLLGRGSLSENQPAAAIPAAIQKPSATAVQTDQVAERPSPGLNREGLPYTRKKDVVELAPLPINGIEEFKDQLRGLSAGDVDGDGTVDIVTITANDLSVYGMKQNRWVRLAQYGSVGNFVGVDTDDLNKNGRHEIFVTNFDNTHSRVISFVLEWDGTTLQPLAAQLPWYFRSVDLAHQKGIIVGQRQGLGDRFSPGIYKMVWKNEAYGPGERLPLPDGVNVFGFAMGAVRSPDKLEVVRYTSDGYIQILDRAGEEAWVSTDTYGGGSNVIIFSAENPKDEPDYVYLAPRIHLHDLDGDGIEEMMAVNNQKSFLTGVLRRHRFYEKGRLEWLKWYGQGIRSTARTLDVARFIADSALVDVDGDGSLDILAAVVKKATGISSNVSSYVAVFKGEPIP